MAEATSGRELEREPQASSIALVEWGSVKTRPMNESAKPGSQQPGVLAFNSAQPSSVPSPRRNCLGSTRVRRSLPRVEHDDPDRPGRGGPAAAWRGRTHRDSPTSTARSVPVASSTAMTSATIPRKTVRRGAPAGRTDRCPGSRWLPPGVRAK